MDLDITQGTNPSYDTRVNYPQLFNLWVNGDGKCYSFPDISAVNESANALLKNVRHIHESDYNGGTYLIITNDAVYTSTPQGNLTFVDNIVYSGLPVKSTENLQNQVTFVDGLKARVIKMSENTLTTLDSSLNFDYKSPVACNTLNSITIIGDADTGQWIVSGSNNALLYSADDYQQIESRTSTIRSLEVLSNNLYIIGNNAIERWVPAIETATFLFPFRKDTDFSKFYGAINSGGVVFTSSIITSDSSNSSGLVDSASFIATDYTVQLLVNGELQTISPDGFPRLINSYVDKDDAIASYYSFNSEYFINFWFPTTQIAWVYSQSSKRWFNIDASIVSASGDFVATNDGIFTFTDERTNDRRVEIVLPIQRDPRVEIQQRNTAKTVIAEIIQGQLLDDEPQYLELAVSKDGLSYGNSVSRSIGKTGNRQAITRWHMNTTAQLFMYRLRYYGKLNITLLRFSTFNSITNNGG